jgi:protein RecA
MERTNKKELVGIVSENHVELIERVPLSAQMKRKLLKPILEKKEYDGNFGTIISTGSTLLDLNISGGRVRGGGLPGGIFIEAFGPNGSGKTVLLSEIAGAVQRQKGEVMFHDPEARLNKQFAQIFGLNLKDENYKTPNTVTQVFKEVRAWEVPKKKNLIHGIFADSLAALSTDMEMEKEDGDKMGMRRAKEFSEELRKTCRIITEKNYLMVCSNQVRVNVDPMSYQKYTTPGGESVGFYASLRLRFNKPEKIKLKKTIAGKETFRIIGVEVEVEVFKSSIWKPYHTAPLYILFDYGIDDIRANLQYVKENTKGTVYAVNETELDKGMETSIKMVEEQGLTAELKEQVIDLWESIEAKFQTERKPKQR